MQTTAFMCDVGLTLWFGGTPVDSSEGLHQGDLVWLSSSSKRARRFGFQPAEWPVVVCRRWNNRMPTYLYTAGTTLEMALLQLGLRLNHLKCELLTGAESLFHCAQVSGFGGPILKSGNI